MPSKKPSRKPEGKQSKPKVDGDASKEFGGEIFNGESLMAIRRKLRGRDFEIVDLKKIKFEAEEGKPSDENWYLYTDAFDQGFKLIDKAGNRLRHAFGNKMGSWIGRKVEIQVVEYGVGTGCDIFPVDDSGDDDADHSEGDVPDDEAVD